jgi:hypothetical protein
MALLGDYGLVRAGMKLTQLRYVIDYPGDADPDVPAAANDRIASAKAESLTTCDVRHPRRQLGLLRCGPL